MQFDFTMAGYGSQNIETAGRFVKYVSGTGKIRVRFDKGGYIDLLPGQGCTGLDFSRLTIEDRSGNNNVGVLLAGAFLFQDDRISGDVSVIDGGKNRTLASLAFMGNCGSLAPGAGNYAFSQMANPAGSGKNMIVESVYLGCASGATVFSTGICANLFTNLIQGGYSKNGGAANSVMQGRRMVAVDATPVAGGKELIAVTVQAAQTFVLAFKEPVVIPPGMQFYVWNATLNFDTRATVEYYEDAI